MRLPSFSELRRFCQRDRWDEKKRTDHWRYTRRLPDGTLLRTKVSFGSGQIQDPGLCSAILRDQLHVTHEEFWRVVNEGGPAIRATTVAAPPRLELPAWLWQQLRDAGASHEQIRTLDPAAAMRLLATLRSRSRS